MRTASTSLHVQAEFGLGAAVSSLQPYLVLLVHRFLAGTEVAYNQGSKGACQSRLLWS